MFEARYYAPRFQRADNNEMMYTILSIHKELEIDHEYAGALTIDNN